MNPKNMLKILLHGHQKLAIQYIRYQRILFLTIEQQTWMYFFSLFIQACAISTFLRYVSDAVTNNCALAQIKDPNLLLHLLIEL